MIFTVFSKNFLPENKLCGWLFTDLHNTYAFSWLLTNFPDFPLARKNHISFINIYITIYVIAFPWLFLSMITLSLTHFGCPVIVPDALNNVQMIPGDNHMKMLPKQSQMSGMTEMTSIDRLQSRVLYEPLGGSCRFWSDLEMFSDNWDYQDDWRLSQKSSLSFH